MIWLPIVGNYTEIDAYASTLAYEELLKQRGKPARNYIPIPPNYSVPNFLRLGELENKKLDFNPKTDQAIILDVSNPDPIHKFFKNEQILELIDHHPGFEEYWHREIGNRAIIEKIGAVATSIFEWWGECWDYSKMTRPVARLLLAAILDNTLNFNAKITTERDRNAAKRLADLAKTTTREFGQDYFSSVSNTVLNNLNNSIINDTKTIAIAPIIPKLAFSQLTIWSATKITGQSNLLRQIMNNISSDWMISIVSIKDRKNYILASSEVVEKYLTHLLELRGHQSWLISDKLYLRKEIIANILASQAET